MKKIIAILIAFLCLITFPPVLSYTLRYSFVYRNRDAYHPLLCEVTNPAVAFGRGPRGGVRYGVQVRSCESNPRIILVLRDDFSRKVRQGDLVKIMENPNGRTFAYGKVQYVGNDFFNEIRLSRMCALIFFCFLTFFGCLASLLFFLSIIKSEER
jgi:hypothetical protein